MEWLYSRDNAGCKLKECEDLRFLKKAYMSALAAQFSVFLSINVLMYMVLVMVIVPVVVLALVLRYIYVRRYHRRPSRGFEVVKRDDNEP